jgi:ATP-dependent helicase/nuclease subunit A
MPTIVQPLNSKWTPDQWSAIHESEKDILVAAAAGSGKTAVLVERIIKKISNPHAPVNVDELLVATFTKAAAAEMRERIREALEKEVFEDPDSEHIRRQLALIHRAAITTLHSFCKDVITRNYQAIDLDPGFRIANETESTLIRQDVLDILMEEKYEGTVSGDSFWKLTEWFGGERGDEQLFKLIMQLYDASRSHPNPDQWLCDMALLFVGEGAGDIWFDSLISDVRLELQSIQSMLRDAIQIATSPGGPLPYLDNLQSEIALVDSFIEASSKSWKEIHNLMHCNVFDRLKPCKKDAFDEALIKRTKETRESAKKAMEKLNEDLFKRSPDDFRYELRMMAPILQELVELVITFAQRYQAAKAEKILVDFSDLEHFCLKVLSIEEDGVLMPTPAAIAYQKQFVEVLLDEYQDTNRVQEAIVSLISRQTPGNRFMVGDVKQSIYRFRLAEPGLFLEKYNRFPKDGSDEGMRIDLAKNFRSRQEIVNGANFIFRQIMSQRVGEVPYGKDAELVYGANYPDELSADVDYTAEVILIDRDKGSNDEGPSIFDKEEDAEISELLQNEMDDIEPARMEAKAISQQIKKLMGVTGDPKFNVFDKRIDGMRPVTYRDIVILLRSPQSAASLIIEELKMQGIPAYAELNTGYFSATEVETLMSLLDVIDNPYQDIALAATLRSSIVGLTADELAKIRAVNRRGEFYEAMMKYVGEELPSDILSDDLSEESIAMAEVAAAVEAPVRRDALAIKLQSFLQQLESWRTDARQGSLADLIWRIYRETNFYDFVGGLPGGVQRQANLKALYDRARQYEATSFRGLYRFLNFIKRMKDAGNDLGTAKALGEQEDVVRIMSIHKSKGLEFPVVFVAGLAKQFNQQDLNGNFLIHKELGFGPKFCDTDLRVSYPSLSSLAIKRRMRMEMLAEEIRVLYVALTRPREKIYLVAAVRNLEKQLHSWAKNVTHEEMLLPDHELAKASSYLDWIGPSLIRHPDAQELRNMTGYGYVEALENEESRWTIRIVEPASLLETSNDITVGVDDPLRSSLVDSVMKHEPILTVSSSLKDEVIHRLQWEYPLAAGATIFSKTSVTELKRIGEISPMTRNAMLDDSWETPVMSSGKKGGPVSTISSRRPRFMEQRKMTAAERGTVFHTVMQNLPIDGSGKSMEVPEIQKAIQAMVDKRLFTTDQADAVDVHQIAEFFKQDIGRRMLVAKNLMREVPFSYGLAAGDIYPDIDGPVAEETILIQGVIDCLFEDEEGLILLDFKTDSVKDQSVEELCDKYRLQINLYSKAIEDTWKRPVSQKYLYFFDGSMILELQ